MSFKNREEGGKKLLKALEKYKGEQDLVIIALPRGGVVVASEISLALDCPLDLVVPRKIGAPSNPEFALGAITEDGQIFIDPSFEEDKDVQAIIDSEIAEAKRRAGLYRAGRGALNLEGKHVIVVDDGIATGNTMKAALQSVRAAKPEKITLAVPLAPSSARESFEPLVDELIILETPFMFGAVGRHYDDFPQTTDEQVIELMKINKAYGK